MNLLERAERNRVEALSTIGYDNLNINEQFFTPVQVAELMAEMLVSEEPLPKKVNLLDPGAGSGMLTVAIVEKIKSISPDTEICVTVVEKDENLISALEQTLIDVKTTLKDVSFEIINENFIYWATARAFSESSSMSAPEFNFIIQNPPYAKLAATGEESLHLKQHGIKVPNIYAAFMALGNKMLAENGSMVAITPRSWMNGPYFNQFRTQLLSESSLKSIHTFESRKEVFQDTGVLQEAIITKISKTQQASQKISISVSRSQAHDITSRIVNKESVLVNGIVFVPTSEEDAEILEWMSRVPSQLSDIGLGVSTGKVVDFRSRDRLVEAPAFNTVPMVYPANFRPGVLIHPTKNAKKPQYYVTENAADDKSLVPGGIYVLVKRFSAKEEKRRITAAMWESTMPAAFDNKTNYFHIKGGGLERQIAEGLCKWLNSSYVDRFFRLFSGHTQVNAGDLRMLPYPNLDQLSSIARVPDNADESVNQVLVSEN